MEEWLVIYCVFKKKIRETVAHNNYSNVEWCSILDKEKNKNKIKITVAYNMVCKIYYVV